MEEVDWYWLVPCTASGSNVSNKCCSNLGSLKRRIGPILVMFVGDISCLGKLETAALLLVVVDVKGKGA